jgi:hypothetical protein
VSKNDVVYILDTNTLSDFWRYGNTRILGRRIAAIENPQIQRRITIIIVEEMIGGRIEALRLDTNTIRDLPHYTFATRHLPKPTRNFESIGLRYRSMTKRKVFTKPLGEKYEPMRGATTARSQQLRSVTRQQ